jgi:uncharacterized protein
LLHKNPARVQSFELTYGQAHVFYHEPAVTQIVSSVLLCTYRVLLTAIYLMRSGEIEANLLTLNKDFRLPFLHELIARKLSGPEKVSISGADISFHEVEVNRLRQELEAAYGTSRLPELPSEETRAH